MRLPPGSPVPPTPYLPCEHNEGPVIAPPMERFLAFGVANQLRQASSRKEAEDIVYEYCSDHIDPKKSLAHNTSTLSRDISIVAARVDPSHAVMLWDVFGDVRRHMPDYWARKAMPMIDIEVLWTYFRRQPSSVVNYAMARAKMSQIFAAKEGQQQAVGRVRDWALDLRMMTGTDTSAARTISEAEENFLSNLPAPRPLSLALHNTAIKTAQSIHQLDSFALRLRQSESYFQTLVHTDEEYHGNFGRISDRLDLLDALLNDGSKRAARQGAGAAQTSLRKTLAAIRRQQATTE